MRAILAITAAGLLAACPAPTDGDDDSGEGTPPWEPALSVWAACDSPKEKPGCYAVTGLSVTLDVVNLQDFIDDVASAEVLFSNAERELAMELELRGVVETGGIERVVWRPESSRNAEISSEFCGRTWATMDVVLTLDSGAVYEGTDDFEGC